MIDVSVDGTMASGRRGWRFAPDPWSWLGQIATVAEGSGRFAVAAGWYERAIEALESRRWGAGRDSWQGVR